MVETTFELLEYLDQRGARYGISGMDLYEQIPVDARSPEAAYAFMQMKDISHIEPLSKGGDPAGDNWVLEDSDVNRARGAETMSNEEIAAAEADGKADANALRKAIIVGGGLAGGQLLFDAALGTAAAAGGAAAGAAPRLPARSPHVDQGAATGRPSAADHPRPAGVWRKCRQ